MPILRKFTFSGNFRIWVEKSGAKYESEFLNHQNWKKMKNQNLNHQEIFVYQSDYANIAFAAPFCNGWFEWKSRNLKTYRNIRVQCRPEFFCKNYFFSQIDSGLDFILHQSDQYTKTYAVCPLAQKGWRLKYRKIQKSKILEYRKTPKISPWAYTFQRPFLGGLFSARWGVGGGGLC